MKQPLLKSMKNQEGMVLVTSLMFMVILFILATTAYLITSSDLKISGNYKTSKQAFYVAEAGIEHAIAVLKETKDFTAALAGPDGNFGDPEEDPTAMSDNGVLSSIGSSVNFAGGTYQVLITDNADEPPNEEDPTEDTNNPGVDVDKKVYITSIGAKDGATSTIVVLFWGNHIPVAVDGAVAIYGDNPGIDMGAGPGGPAFISGHDHDLPDDFTCSGVNCEGDVLDPSDPDYEPPVPGLYVEVDETEIDPADYVDEVIPGPPTIDPNIVGDPAVEAEDVETDKLDEWLNVVNTTIPDITLSGSTTIASNTVYGDRDDPVVVLVEGDLVHASGTIDGAGVLIIEGNLQITGTLHWEGIIIVASDADLVVTATGNFTLLGALVVAPDAGASATVELNGNAEITYSSQALENTEEVFENSKIIAWENQYN